MRPNPMVANPEVPSNVMWNALSRRMTGLLLVAAAALAGGCDANPFCLNCGDLGVDAAPVDLTMPDLVVPDLAMPDLARPVDMRRDMCSSNLMSDPNNCGTCGHRCSEFPHASGVCEQGQCEMGDCQPGWYDLDGDGANGCEYACIPSTPAHCQTGADCPFGLPCTAGSCAKQCASDGDCPSGTRCDPNTRLCEGEFCDGRDNDCDGTIDDGFDLQTDVANCGVCGHACSFPSGAAACVGGHCQLTTCDTAHYDLDRNAVNGCEYYCHQDVPGSGGGIVQVPIDPPRAETCNGLDDDCDGIVDNGPTDVGQPCDDSCPRLDPCVAAGTCAKPSACQGRCCGLCQPGGTTTCVAGLATCQAMVSPQLETCNGQDDNCDGRIDEGFDLQTDPLNCGACGHSCVGTLSNAVATCAGGQCVVASCKPGYNDLDHDVANGCEYTCPVNPSTVESCNGKDDDCDGVVDNNLQQPANFCVQNSLCIGSVPVCCGDAGWVCNYPEVDARIEVQGAKVCPNGHHVAALAFTESLCDGQDGNCNGQADEAFTNLHKPCTVGKGRCAGQSTFTCDPDDPTRTICPTDEVPTNAVDEQCNGIDDDCDGQIDQAEDSSGTCYNGGAHTCRGWRDLAVQVGTQWVYQFEASHPGASNMVVGSDTTRACSQPGVLPWAPVTRAQAAAACASVNDSAGSPMHLCDASVWQTACEAGVAGGWAYATNATAYQPLTCNGADQDIGAAWPTGEGAQCYANTSGGKVYDLSGNVSEWTSSSFDYDGTRYYDVRGGAFTTNAGGTACAFDFLSLPDGYQYQDIGFRCCADHAP